ncbi:MAG: TlpA family protein disulfide reductase [Deltaproteobacteria bacterium]|nr:TlpA family protein disulfide reductase [Deltaproteobacteria bacterium]
MTEDKRQGPWLAQVGFAVLAGLAVYGFVDMAKNAEIRRACEPLVQLRPQYLGYDRAAPAFDLPTIDGKRVKLSDHAGKVVILHFWTKTCKPCLDELPFVSKFAEQIKDRKDVVLITVTIDENPASIADVVQTVFEGKPPNVVIAFDPENAIVRDKYGTKLFPETWLIDPSGAIRARFDGVPMTGEQCDVAWNTPMLLSAIDALKGPAVCDIVVDPKLDPRPEKLIAPCRR